MSKHEEWLAAFVESGSAESLMHFNDKHDSNGRFAKKNGGSSGYKSPKPANYRPYHDDLGGMETATYLSFLDMDKSKLPESTYHHTYEGKNGIFVNNAQYQIAKNITTGLLAQNSKNNMNLLAGVSMHGNGLANKTLLKQVMFSEVMSAYEQNVKDERLAPGALVPVNKFEDMVWNIIDEEVDKECDRQGKANMGKEINLARRQAAFTEKKKGAKLTLQDRINAAYKEASDANANRPSASIQTLKGKLSSLVDKVSASAKSGKDKTASLVSKGKKYLDNAFTTTTTTYHTQAEKMGNSAKKGLTTVKTTFNTQADKLKQKKKSLFTKTKYDTSSYKNA